MKLIIIKAIIGWLWRNHKYLLIEAVIPSDAHIHRNPTKKQTADLINHYSPVGPNPATGGVDS